SLPNGALILTTGTLLRAQTEEQVAHILAHEVAHYRHRDSLKQFNRLLNTSSAVALLGVAAAGIGVDFVGTGASMAALNARYAHSQSDERAADASAVRLAAAAGYNPLEAADLWDQIDLEAAADGKRSAFARVHPTSDDRFALMAASAHAAPRAAPFATPESWNDATLPWLQGWIADELRRSQAAGNVALFTRLSAAQPSRGLYRYALGEAYRKRALPGDAVLAQTAFRAALAAADAPPQAWRGLGLTAMQGGDKDTARTAFARYRAALPDAEDKAIIDYYLAQP
ncbi:MAG: M48 family metalloprotease, partial [Pseudomonadota bacterium]